MGSRARAKREYDPARPLKTAQQSVSFDAELFLSSNGPGRRLTNFQTGETIFSQGDPGNHVMYVRDGAVMLTVVNASGKEAVVEVVMPGDFFGLTCLAGREACTATARTILPTTVLIIEKNEMIRVLHAGYEISDRFIANLLAKNARGEQALTDQLFNSSEKRLARTLLLLAGYGRPGQRRKVIPKISQEILAEMIGTTRPRVNFFMNKFRKLGFIEYDGNHEVHVEKSLLSVPLHA